MSYVVGMFMMWAKKRKVAMVGEDYVVSST